MLGVYLCHSDGFIVSTKHREAVTGFARHIGIKVKMEGLEKGFTAVCRVS